MTQRVRMFAGATLALVIAAGCGLGGKQESAVSAPQVVATTEAPVVEVTTEPPPPPQPTPSKTSKAPTKKLPPSKATPTEDPNNFQEPACKNYDGKAASKPAVKAALNAAAAKHYWPKSAPGLTVPANLVRAIAWHESGWQSNIVNCDGGRGLMQLMPGTIELINRNFVQSYDAHEYRQNAIIGANYLAWLTKYIGDMYFAKNYSLSTAKCKTESSWCLLNLVIAAYQAGVGAVETAGSTRTVPNDHYVYIVRSLMKSCYCDRY